ncbi:hypothetical protein HPB50_014154 [Hyalomma asiaticum]|uniref:Uncharacterized protein n=1 Tax=Hyalomma asiaticum TaxID=266040 RepID=A0ACB7TKI0_HYAAI|nr:hypothetical protein HPB50_014154 [Hyalomma asiaticum]
MVDPVPRNIHPVHHEGRRFARAKAILQKINQQKLEALFVDAARYHGGDKFAISVVDAGGNMVNAASVYTKTAHVAEEAAIALALQSAKAPAVVYSDSRTAVRSFSSALVSQQANSICRNARCRAAPGARVHAVPFTAIPIVIDIRSYLQWNSDSRRDFRTHSIWLAYYPRAQSLALPSRC